MVVLKILLAHLLVAEAWPVKQDLSLSFTFAFYFCHPLHPFKLTSDDRPSRRNFVIDGVVVATHHSVHMRGSRSSVVRAALEVREGQLAGARSTAESLVLHQLCLTG